MFAKEKHPLWGKKHSECAKEKMRNKRSCRPVVCVETGKVFCNASEAGRFLGNRQKGCHINQVLRGERKTAFGFSWKYYEE
jgi:hypothetical protein